MRDIDRMSQRKQRVYPHFGGIRLPSYDGIYDDEPEHVTFPSERRRLAGKIAENTLLFCLIFMLGFGLICILANALGDVERVQQETMIHPLSAEMEDLQHHDFNP